MNIIRGINLLCHAGDSNGEGAKEEYKYPQNVVQYVQTEYFQILRLITLIMTAIQDFPNVVLTLLKLSLASVCAYCSVGLFQ